MLFLSKALFLVDKVKLVIDISFFFDIMKCIFRNEHSEIKIIYSKGE